jgi:hypothetical protein
MPVMLVNGDADMIRPEHMVQFYHLLGGGQKDAGWEKKGDEQERGSCLPGLLQPKYPAKMGRNPHSVSWRRKRRDLRNFLSHFPLM